jgi:hypothetical protein
MDARRREFLGCEGAQPYNEHSSPWRRAPCRWRNYLGPGLRATYDRFSAYTLIGLPIVNHMNGLQSKSDYKVLTGMSFAF